MERRGASKLSFSGLLSCHNIFRSELFAGTNLLHDVLRKDCDVAGGRGNLRLNQVVVFHVSVSDLEVSVMLNKLDDRVEEESPSKTKNQHCEMETSALGQTG